MLRELIQRFGRQWSVIASHIPNRNATQVAARWEKCINPILTKGQFSTDEDRLITEFVAENGIRVWPKITAVLPYRTPKQCRERWFNNLDPAITKSPWTPEEDLLIFEAYVKYGPKWSMIAPMVAGRSDNAVKNRWNASISKRMSVSEDGQPELLTNRKRKYTRRNQRRPPPLIAPEPPADPLAMPAGAEGGPPASIVTAIDFTPRGWVGSAVFGDGMTDLDALEPLRMPTPLHSPFGSGASLFSPVGFSCDF
jgi:hypothetical protein